MINKKVLGENISSREEKYNQAVKTLIDQTQSKFFEDYLKKIMYFFCSI